MFLSWIFGTSILCTIGFFSWKYFFFLSPPKKKSNLPIDRDKKDPKKFQTLNNTKKKEEKNGKHLPHPLLTTTLKGHTHPITSIAFNANGRFVATSSADRSILLYFMQSIENHNVKSHRINIEYDHATALGFNCEGKILSCATEGGKVQLYHKLKVKPELLIEFSIDHKSNVHSIIVNDIDQCAVIITCAGGDDTDVKVWNQQGEMLHYLNTNQLINYEAVASIDNRFLAVAAYTPEVKILQASRTREGNFIKLEKAMALQGHQQGVTGIAFDGSTQLPVNHVVTVSKDGLVRLWDINVRYTLNEDPRLIKYHSRSDKLAYEHVAISPNGKIIALSQSRSLIYLNALTMEIMQEIEHAHEADIEKVIFSVNGKYVLVSAFMCKHCKLYQAPKVAAQ